MRKTATGILAAVILFSMVGTAASEVDLNAEDLAKSWAKAFLAIDEKEIVVKAVIPAAANAQTPTVLTYKEVSKVQAIGALLMITHKATAISSATKTAIRADLVIEITSE
jgi:hypothetical protein